MVQKALQELGLNMKNVVMIGDKLIDVKLVKNLRVQTVLVLIRSEKKELDKLKDENDKSARSMGPDFVTEKPTPSSQLA